ncbi:RyR domain-containing protein [Thiothrix nivea]|uniref:Ryanodine receptor Ryr n=1 Tax=Thiothrix nivea (strain ATCC 35100 / DSM 5205 / JP2) TaxID=870187 RepID=A0A656HIC4_THINJ|nr:RyR domain-containing protein [Thiothrix nivea]EIJ35246.1 Ryanodine receptor Ryr [Thiothrix nivea DSM 5205]
MNMDEHEYNALHGHIIVCSLNRQGRAFIANLRRQDPQQPIVALLREAETQHANFCEQQRVSLVSGDVRSASSLREAGLARAKAIIACSYSTATNLQTATAVRQILGERADNAGQLNLYLALSATALREGLESASFRQLLHPDSRLNPYVYSEETLLARWYFNQYPPHSWADRYGQQQVHLVLAGSSPLVEALVCQYAKISPYKAFAPPIFTLLGVDAEQQRQVLVARYPALANGLTGAEQVIAGLYAVECDEACQLPEGELEGAAPVTAVLCCSHDDDWNARCALRLRESLGGAAPFYVYEGHGSTDQVEDLDGLVPFGMPEQVFDLEQLAAVERNARAVHDAYRQQMQVADPQAAATAEGLQPWEQLPETYRAANRRAGDHMPVKLASIGYPLEAGKPLTPSDSIVLDEPPARRELLSRLEHRSWRYERLLNGWCYGAVRDNQQRLHPSIVLWEDLPESERQKDVEQMKNVLRVLQDA